MLGSIFNSDLFDVSDFNEMTHNTTTKLFTAFQLISPRTFSPEISFHRCIQCMTESHHHQINVFKSLPSMHKQFFHFAGCGRFFFHKKIEIKIFIQFSIMLGERAKSNENFWSQSAKPNNLYTQFTKKYLCKCFRSVFVYGCVIQMFHYPDLFLKCINFI